MTHFTEKMTVEELIEVSADVASLRPKAAPKTVNGARVIALVAARAEIVAAADEISLR